jgi:hypothetical protein
MSLNKNFILISFKENFMRNVLLVLLVFLTLPALASKFYALSFKLANLEKIDGFIGSKEVTLYELKKQELVRILLPYQ